MPVRYTVSGGVEDGGVKLTAADADGHKVSVYSADEPQPAQKDPLPGVERALGKTGGTPFVMAGLTAEAGEGGLGFLPGSVWNEMRREALDRLLEKRSEVRPHATQDITLPAYPAHTVGQVPALAARFANAAQCPAEVVDKLQYLIFPIAEAESIPAAWRGKTLLELPRVMFGKLEQRTAARLDALQDAGFAGAVVNNPAQLRLADGWTLYGGLGLNVTNPMSAARYAALGMQGMLLQPETALTAMTAIAPRCADGGAVLRPPAPDADPCLPFAQCAGLRQMSGRRHTARPQGPRLYRNLLGPRRGRCAHGVQPCAPLYG